MRPHGAPSPRARLAKALEALARAPYLTAHPSPSTPLEPIPGVVHEWIGIVSSAPSGGRSPWLPPLALVAHLARTALDGAPRSARVLWIGRRAWPYPRALIAGENDRALLDRSLFVDPRDDAERLWAIDLALRSRGVAAVVADAGNLTMPASRRLQLAAASGNTPALLLRPPREARSLSAAQTRWLVRHAPSPDRNPRWTVELLRCKGVRPATEESARTWLVRRDHETGDVALAPDASRRAPEARRPALRQTA